MKKRFIFLVGVEVPSEVMEQDAKGYVEDAVQTHCGSLHPPGGLGLDDDGDPLFETKCLFVRNAARSRFNRK
jgi:hypothetical protein